MAAMAMISMVFRNMMITAIVIKLTMMAVKVGMVVMVVTVLMAV